jgi:hypothetical protein
MPALFLRLALLLTLIGLTACESPRLQEQLDARKAAIAAEAPGDYYIGRRFRIDRTHFWGYLRRPRQSWEQSKLVVMNERSARQPDRLREEPSDGSQAFGYDHNSEYRVWGNYTGRRVYDPNSDLALPEFQPTRFELIQPAPGWLFKPNERFNGFQLFRGEPEATP